MVYKRGIYLQSTMLSEAGLEDKVLLCSGRSSKFI